MDYEEEAWRRFLFHLLTATYMTQKSDWPEPIQAKAMEIEKAIADGLQRFDAEADAAVLAADETPEMLVQVMRITAAGFDQLAAVVRQHAYELEQLIHEHGRKTEDLD